MSQFTSYFLGATQQFSRSIFHRKLMRDGAISFALKLISTLLQLITALLLARMLGPEGYGTYAFALAVVTLLSVPAKLGLPNLVVRQTARYRLQAQWSLLKGLWRWSMTTALMLSVVFASVAGLGVFLYEASRPDASHMVFTYAIALMVLMTLAELRGAALRGLGYVVVGQVPDLFLRPAAFFLAVSVFVLIAPRSYFSPDTVMLLHAIAAAVALVFGSSVLGRVRPEESAQARPEYDGAAWRATMLPLGLLAGIQVINRHADVVMLGVMTDSESVGLYKLAAQISLFVAFGLQAINTVIAPRVAHLHATGEVQQLQRLITMCTRFSFAAAALAVAVFAFFGEWLLTIAAGEAFATSYQPLLILCIGQLVSAAAGAVGLVLIMSGHERHALRGVAVAAICNVLLNVVLIPFFGASGAAFATAVSIIVWNLLLARKVRELLGIESTIFGRA